MVVEEYPGGRLDVVCLEASYRLAETFEPRDREVIESVYPFYAYDWTARLRAKLSLAPADAGTYLAHLKQRLSAAASEKVAFRGFVPRPELIDLYYDADVFAFPPLCNAGFRIPPIKSIAAWTP